MTTFGKKLRECREAKGLSQQEFAKMLKTSHSVIGRYERDEMAPSIEVVKKWPIFRNDRGIFIGRDPGVEHV